MTKRILALLLCLSLCLSLIPAAFAEDIEIADEEETLDEIALIEPETVPALPDEPEAETVASGECGDELTWTLDSNGKLIISGTGEMWDYTSSVRPSWYSDHSGIRSVVIEDGVTSVGAFAFCSYDSPYSLLTKVTLPASITSLGNECFYKTGLKGSLKLPNGLKTIGQYCFNNCENLTDVTFPSSVTSIATNAFAYCFTLSTVTFLGAPAIGSNCFYSVVATVYYPDDGSWSESARQQYGGTLTWTSYPGGQCGDNLRWKVVNNTLYITGTGAMTNYSYTNYNGQQRSPWDTYSDSILYVEISEGVTSIGDWAFYYEHNFTEVLLPNSVRRIGDHAFYACDGLKQMHIGPSVTTIETAAFGGCESMTSITVDENNSSFSSLDGVLFNKGQTTLLAFPAGKGGVYTVPSTVRSIGRAAFLSCYNVEEVILPDGIETVEYSAFQVCRNMKKINLPEGLTTIGGYAFSDCSLLTSVSIPSTVKTIGENAFQYSGLDTIYFFGSAPSIGDYCFQNVTATAYYPDDGTWTDDVKKQYGGTITWEPMNISELTLYKDHTEIAVGQSEKLEVNTTVPLVWTSSNETAATVDDQGVVTAHKYGKAKITCTTQNGMASASCEVQTLFWDVADSSKYYFRHVYWAAEKGITKGYNLEYFDPQGTCTREQMMTFLWRLAGQPNPKTTNCPFPDVKKSDYFYKAVLWGVEKKITAGFSEGEYAGKFGVGLPCTREQAMTFLWRMAGKPDPGTTTNPFSDIRSTDYFYKAVLWAAKNGIANGYADGTYGYGVPCLREHMVTFLSRYASKFM